MEKSEGGGTLRFVEGIVIRTSSSLFFLSFFFGGLIENLFFSSEGGGGEEGDGGGGHCVYVVDGSWVKKKRDSHIPRLAAYGTQQYPYPSTGLLTAGRNNVTWPNRNQLYLFLQETPRNYHTRSVSC